MGWDDGDKNNPWQKNDRGPADLDAIVRDFQRRLGSLFGGGRRRGNGSGGGGKLAGGAFGGIVAIAIAAWLVTGVYTVDEAERAIVLRFGEHVSTQQPGLRWHWPWPIETYERINISENVSYPYSGSMLTRDENIVNIDLIVQYRRTNPEDYLFGLEEPEPTLEFVTASAIREVVGKNELDFIITDGRAEVAAQTQDLLQTTLDEYGTGIAIFEVNLQNANFPADVESAVQDAIQAREDRERFILQAETYSNDLLPRARGQAARQLQDAEAYRARAVANAEGEADRFVQLLREYQRAPEVTRERLYIETLEEILSNSSKVLVDTEGGNNLLYLPLDQLMQQQGRRPNSNEGQLPSLPTPQRSVPSSTPQTRSSR
ncbi:MAG TPA: FtsH protease activity modulator HflK [Gammaproteobacteria bacterium]|nr:FtsH protease activity modulator HflK [Gammaproteobacteria bacterium]